jgi:hypothetical protein
VVSRKEKSLFIRMAGIIKDEFFSPRFLPICFYPASDIFKLIPYFDDFRIEKEDEVLLPDSTHFLHNMRKRYGIFCCIPEQCPVLPTIV